MLRWWSGISCTCDFTKPEALAYYVRRLKDFAGRYGFAGFKFDAVCLEAKSDNVQEWSLRLLGAGSAARAGASCFPPTAEEPSRFSADEGNHAFGTHDAE